MKTTGSEGAATAARADVSAGGITARGPGCCSSRAARATAASAAGAAGAERATRAVRRPGSVVTGCTGGITAPRPGAGVLTHPADVDGPGNCDLALGPQVDDVRAGEDHVSA